METDFGPFFLICIIILAVLTFLCLVRAIRGPKIADRILAGNMIGTLTITIILLLSVYLNESYIIDVCLVYAVISFIAIVVITKIYVGLYREQKSRETADTGLSGNGPLCSPPEAGTTVHGAEMRESTQCADLSDAGTRPFGQSSAEEAGI